MRAVTLDSFDAAPGMRDDLPDPTAAANGARRACARASVNPVDNAIAAGMLREMTNGAAGEGPGRSNVMAVPSGDDLSRLAALLDAGSLQVHIDETFELDRATDALQALAAGHVRGKLAINVGGA